MFNFQKNILLFFMLFLLNACLSHIPLDGDKYSIEECKRELINASDYTEDMGIDLIVIEKKEHKMYLYKDNKLQGTVPISLGKNPVGPKIKKGDNKTPEGTFRISRKLCSQRYYRSLCISYPRPEDRRKALRRGLDPGGDITIHAQPVWNADGRGDNYTLSHDWTQGCVAVTNDTMKKLWYSVHKGLPVIIR